MIENNLGEISLSVLLAVALVKSFDIIVKLLNSKKDKNNIEYKQDNPINSIHISYLKEDIHKIKEQIEELEKKIDNYHIASLKRYNHLEKDITIIKSSCPLVSQKTNHPTS